MKKNDPSRQAERRRFAERFHAALTNAGFPPDGQGRQRAVSEAFDMSDGGARRWLKGESYPEMHKLLEISDTLGVRVEWLLTGAGPMLKSDRPETAAPESPVDGELLGVVMAAVDAELAAQGKTAGAEAKARAISRLYARAASAGGKIDPLLAHDLVAVMA